MSCTRVYSRTQEALIAFGIVVCCQLARGCLIIVLSVAVQPQRLASSHTHASLSSSTTYLPVPITINHLLTRTTSSLSSIIILKTPPAVVTTIAQRFTYHHRSASIDMPIVSKIPSSTHPHTDLFTAKEHSPWFGFGH